jgi:Clr5 domain
MDAIGKAMLAPSFVEVGTEVAHSSQLFEENYSMSLAQLASVITEDTIPGGHGCNKHGVIANPTSSDWETYRPIFTYYYKGKGLPLRAVRNIMARQYGFIAT